MSLRSEVVRIFNELLAGSKKISELTSLPSNVQDTDLIEVVRSGQNYKALGSQLPSGGGGTGDLQDVLDAGSTAVAPTDISIDAGAGTQFFIGENAGFAQMNLHGSAMNLFADTGLTIENGAAGSFGINTTQPININADGGTAGEALLSQGAGLPPVWGSAGGPNGLAAVDTTGTAISFAVPQIYGSDASPETGNITIVTTGLVKGMTQLLIHNNGSEPTYGSPIKIISGAYVTGELNYIMLLAVSTTSVLVTISQEV